MRKVSRGQGVAIAILAGLGAAIAPASADVVVGGDARLAGMGGAGIALVDQPSKTAWQNPAALALDGGSRQFRFYVPRLGLHNDNIGVGDLQDAIKGFDDEDEAVDLVSKLGKRDSVATITAGLGGRFGVADLMATGAARVRIQANPALEEWANNNPGNADALTGQERGDLFGAAVYTLPAIGAAHGFALADGRTRLEVGARIKFQHAIYTHYRINADAIENDIEGRDNPEEALLASEMGGKSTLEKSGVGIDLGFLLHAPQNPGLSAGMVITNVLNPKLRFDGTDNRDRPTRYNLDPTNVAIGVAYRQEARVFVADLVDINSQYDRMGVRFGGEYTLRRGIALRAGYSSRDSLTFGAGFGGFDIAIGSKVPIGISHSIRF